MPDDTQSADKTNVQASISDGRLYVSVTFPSDRVLLRHPAAFANQLNEILVSIMRDVTHDPNPDIDFELPAFSRNSLDFEIAPVGGHALGSDPTECLDLLTLDLDAMASGSFRSSMSSATLKRYKGLMDLLRREKASINFRYDDRDITVNRPQRVQIEKAASARTKEAVTLYGRLESVNRHHDKPTFNLYPKLTPNDPVECTFPDTMMRGVADILKYSDIVQVTGIGTFGPVGIYPVRIVVTEPPKRLPYDEEKLRAVPGSLRPTQSRRSTVQRKEAQLVADLNLGD
jgi:hypothetical protein